MEYILYAALALMAYQFIVDTIYLFVEPIIKTQLSKSLRPKYNDFALNMFFAYIFQTMILFLVVLYTVLIHV